MFPAAIRARPRPAHSGASGANRASWPRPRVVRASPRPVALGVGRRRGMAQAASRRRQRRRVLVTPVERDPFRVAFDHAPVGIAIHDPVGEIVAVNPAMCRLLGRDQVDLAGFLEVVHPDERVSLHRRLRSLIAGEAPDVVAEHRLIHADGTRLSVRVHVTATSDRTGVDHIAGHPRGGCHRAARADPRAPASDAARRVDRLAEPDAARRPARPCVEPGRTRRRHERRAPVPRSGPLQARQ